ncbi:ferredoxin reductase family protein [Pseudoxanthomonas wuyuanensis]
MPIKSWQAVLIPSVLSFALVAAELPQGDRLSTAAFSLSAGVAALALMAIAAMLSARVKFVESGFGGLDRVYRAHKWLGVWALGLASFHLLFKAGMQGWDTAAIVSMPPPLTRFVRQLSFVGLMFIVLLALNRNIRYGLWRWWHKLSGPLFAVVVLHWLSFRSPIALASPAGVWLAVLSALGIAAALYKLLLYRHLSGRAEYRVVAVSPGQAAAHLQLEPVGKGITFRPGQFGFLRMKSDGLREPHPFTVASGSSANGQVDFVIRALGDFTAALVAGCRVGMHAEIHGPYGRFERRRRLRREIWIGGGVGISPFIAWLKDPQAGGFDKVTLFYFFTPGREFPAVEVLQSLAHERGAEFVPIADGPSSEEFRRRFAAIAEDAGPDAVGVDFCGPQGLLREIRRRMRASAVPEANLRHEYFDFR